MKQKQEETFLITYGEKKEGAQVFASPKLWALAEMANKENDVSLFDYFQVPLIKSVHEKETEDKDDFLFFINLIARSGARFYYDSKLNQEVFSFGISKEIANSHYQSILKNKMTKRKKESFNKSFDRFLIFAKKIEEIDIEENFVGYFNFKIYCKNYNSINEQLFDSLFVDLNDFRELKSAIAMFYSIMTVSQVKSVFYETTVSYETLDSLSKIAGISRNTATKAINNLSRVGAISFIFNRKYENGVYHSDRYWIADRLHEGLIFDRLLSIQFQSNHRYKLIEIVNSFGRLVSSDYSSGRLNDDYKKVDFNSKDGIRAKAKIKPLIVTRLAK